MVELNELELYINAYLEVARFDDYAPNGLQVEGRREVRKIIVGVTACQALIDEAVAGHADLILVHHGYFWRGEDARVIGMKAQRLRRLLCHDISMMAYHLPLDAHEVVGNNAQLATRLSLTIKGSFGEGKVPLAVHGELNKPVSADEFAGRLQHCLGRVPVVIKGHDKPVYRVGLCSGAAQNYIHAAADLGLDAFVTGEISESTVHVARERKINFFSAGHHATEKFGVCALGEHLTGKFGLDCRFVDIDNPV